MNICLKFYFLLFLKLLPEVNSSTCQVPEIVTRDEWGARPPTMVENMTNPVPYVVIHHSYIPAACYTKGDCIKAMQWMQDYHQFNQSWNDIGYSFAAGSDSRVYIGRGWSAVGAHAPGYNNISIGICLIGDWTENVPPQGQLTAVKQLICTGVNQGYIMKNYKLIGHRQVRETECPGDALFQEIQSWPHWIPSPSRNYTKVSFIPKEGLTSDPNVEIEDLTSEDNKLKRDTKNNV